MKVNIVKNKSKEKLDVVSYIKTLEKATNVDLQRILANNEQKKRPTKYLAIRNEIQPVNDEYLYSQSENCDWYYISGVSLFVVENEQALRKTLNDLKTFSKRN